MKHVVICSGIIAVSIFIISAISSMSGPNQLLFLSLDAGFLLTLVGIVALAYELGKHSK